MSADEDDDIPYDTIENLSGGEINDLVVDGLTFCVGKSYAWCKKDERGKWVPVSWPHVETLRQVTDWQPLFRRWDDGEVSDE